MKRKVYVTSYAHAWCHVCRHLLEVRVNKPWDVTVLVCQTCSAVRDVLSHTDHPTKGAVLGQRYIPKAV